MKTLPEALWFIWVVAAAESVRDVTMTNLRDWLNCDFAMGDNDEVEEDCCWRQSHYSDEVA